jgi:hypothetical protein
MNGKQKGETLKDEVDVIAFMDGLLNIIQKVVKR